MFFYAPTNYTYFYKLLFIYFRYILYLVFKTPIYVICMISCHYNNIIILLIGFGCHIV